MALETRPSVTAFFPAYNDAGTIASMVVSVYSTLERLVDDFEVLVINDGSRDHTREVLATLERAFPRLRVIDHDTNRGYGGALRSGFFGAKKDLVFYTDGDAQYDPREVELLLAKMRNGVDMVNGWKISRSDPLHRIIIGKIYCWLMKLMFRIRLRDIDCDFRLIRRGVFDDIQLESSSGTICVELVKKIERAGCRVEEVPVHHFFRAYGKSQFFNLRRLFTTAVDLTKLWMRLMIHDRRRDTGEPARTAR
ncbi:MAG: glycosyltransferase family 2 protein [Acidobacteriota bacterium]